MKNDKKRLIIGISGASGAIYAIRLLEVLKPLDHIETHLIISNAAKQTIAAETDYSIQAVKALADVNYDVRDIGAAISSGSYRTLGMIILPCSIKTLSGIAHSYTDDLITRAADVCLKERKPLVLCVRETPLHLGHLRLMTQAAEIGAQITPLMPAFYHHPKTVQDIVDQSVNRLCDQFEIQLAQDLFQRWGGEAQ
ncbi:TPA: UbiX family flavin prenyltransferase [Pasteurella multocida]|uniref:UbiX family flavin prenyltransferase n=1 Tax=Pasteurella multocida TaxID=747 RepID=UPI000282885A|nr:UbiX family flavin prenyltransferase [Pasteurella multocida]APB80226.1 3-octaprenyl-4-hydroxybenzoate carboxy-lyase [Pasteurella multocida]ARB72939.1 UbiX family flavin prenyltransferase [Pasteurella multocida]EJZ79403.1 3-polyprenyl-4-hydroxybenzoate carboxy-lyase UbiX [Pasteurella multocida subsp. gallicida X73]EPE75536.1 3-octaprenyl-4-hydroxybenzoate carboxy-lyase [Pasteurella multocida 1500C]ERL41907.1 3-octaprenyl-4-hydroxybenzoate carboxy-lyase [Pasteurella multocida subsp. multocida